jgi:serine/threonine protein kinase
VASASGFLNVLKALVSKGANIFAEDRWGRTLIEDAKMGNFVDVVEYLESQGAQSKSKAILKRGSFRASAKSLDETLSTPVLDAYRLSKETLSELQARGVREMWSWNKNDFLVDEAPFAKGPHGDVYLGQICRTDCVIKSLRGLRGTDEELTALANEIQLLALIRHPNIVTFFGACFQLSPPIIILEYCRYGTLENAINKAYHGGGYHEFSQIQKFSYASQIASAMNFLHGFHIPIIHRALTPSNIMFASKDVLKITDFGLAKFLPKMSELGDTTAPAVITGDFGSYRYMAPEVYEEKRYNVSVDVYSYSMILYYLFSGIKPFYNTPDGLTALKLATQGKRPSSKVIPDLRIQDLVESCWEQNPNSRPSFEQICDVLYEVTLFSPSGIPIKLGKAKPKAQVISAALQSNNGNKLNNDKNDKTSIPKPPNTTEKPKLSGSGLRRFFS